MTTPGQDAAKRAEELRGKIIGILFRRKLMRNYVKDENVPVAFQEIDQAIDAAVAEAVKDRDEWKSRYEATARELARRQVWTDEARREERERAVLLHGYVETACNGWLGALPHGDNVSGLVLQDRMTAEDLKRKADAALSRRPPARAPEGTK